jgi:hypothetical protein
LPDATYPMLPLSRFVADLSIDRIPADVVARAKELFIDALSGLGNARAAAGNAAPQNGGRAAWWSGTEALLV